MKHNLQQLVIFVLIAPMAVGVIALTGGIVLRSIESRFLGSPKRPDDDNWVARFVRSRLALYVLATGFFYTIGVGLNSLAERLASAEGSVTDGLFDQGLPLQLGLASAAALTVSCFRLVSVWYYPNAVRGTVLGVYVLLVAMTPLAPAFINGASMVAKAGVSDASYSVLGSVGTVAILYGLLTEACLHYLSAMGFRWGDTAGQRAHSGHYRCTICLREAPVDTMARVLTPCPVHKTAKFNLRRESVSWPFLPESNNGQRNDGDVANRA